MSLHLHPIEAFPEASSATPMDAVFLVVQRANGHWSPAAKVMEVWHSEELAESHAAALKKQHPQQTFGVFVLRSEARQVLNPIEIVRVGDSHDH